MDRKACSLSTYKLVPLSLLVLSSSQTHFLELLAAAPLHLFPHHPNYYLIFGKSKKSQGAISGEWGTAYGMLCLTKNSEQAGLTVQVHGYGGFATHQTQTSAAICEQALC
jgi:hypothetical protein